MSMLEAAAAHARIVAFCGIPGVGKSLLLREQLELALAAGRRVTRLQWDVARQAFETPGIPARRRYLVARCDCRLERAPL
jgi:putative protein kinase ArgK-like GTPase of G3E family